MNVKSCLQYIFCISFFFALIACDDKNIISSDELATVVFDNQSSFDVKIYRNFNPEQDPASYIGTSVSSAPNLTLKLPPSGAGEVGCTFFLRYQLLLPGSVITGVNDKGVMAGAAPTWANIPIVIRANGNYIIPIDQPTVDELRFVRGYITVQNLNTNRVWLERGNSPQYRLDNVALWLNPGDIGFYEIAMTPGQESVPANMFHIRDEQARSTTIDPFELSQGNVYWFEFNQIGVRLINTLDILAPFR